MTAGSPPRLIWRLLAVMGGLLLGALWLIGSGLALGLRECPPDATTAGLCEARHATLLAALEAAIVLGGAVVCRMRWPVHRAPRPPGVAASGPSPSSGVLGLCADRVLVGQVPPVS